MPYQDFKNKVFKRYNIAVVLVFIIIIIMAVAFGFLRYQSELDSYTKQSLIALSDQGNELNSILEHSVQTIKGMQKFANYSLTYPDELSAKAPKLLQDGVLFYLDTPRHRVSSINRKLSGNITGLGKVDLFEQDKINEIAMANALTPAFISANMTLPAATWFYYISFNQFVNIYPWIDRKNWHYTDKMLNNSYMDKVARTPLDATEHFWSPPYIDSAGSGLNTSLSIGVVNDNKVAGAIVININLASLEKTLPDLSSPKHGIVLLNNENRVLAYKHQNKSALSAQTSWQDVLPEALGRYSASELSSFSNSHEVEGWILQKYQLPVNDWTLIKYQPYADFTAPVRSRFMLVYLLFISGLVAFLTLVYLLTRSTFIKPATDFMNHIEYCAQGDPGKIKPTADWLHWFNIVENIFGQNRSLLQQLKEKNKDLDLRVIEKTKALIDSSQHHQRDSALLRSVMNAMPELIIFNDDKNQLIGCNKAFEAYVQQTETVMLSTEVARLMPASLGNALIELSNKSLHANNINSHDDDLLLSSNSIASSYQHVVETNSHTYEVVSRQFFNNSGKSQGTINIFRDVTEQYEIQSALKSAKNQAEYANKAKNQFLANMSHEIRTPINAIQGMMALLEQSQLNSHQLHYLVNAQNASTSLLHLIEELLDLSKIEAGKMFISKYATNLDVIVNKALKLNLGMILSSDIALIVDISPDVPQIVMTDEMRLVQVLTNLLNNAVKFTHQGEIKLTVELTAKSQSNVLVRFTVKDDGIGIAKDKQRYLFDAFSQADESMTREYGGSGLGLSICQQIVNLLGGTITLDSELSVGSSFSFVLPFSLPSTDTLENDHDSDLSKDVLVCNLRCELSVNLIHSIEILQWSYLSVNSLTDIEMLANHQQIILLVDGGSISLDDFQNIEDLLATPQHSIALLAICQEAVSAIPLYISERLNQLPLPYIMLDKPLYRFSITEMNNALLARVSDKNVLVDSCSLNNNSNNNTSKNANVTRGDALVEKRDLSDIIVLLVEDNLVNQLVAKELLLNMHAKVFIAENGQNALDILAEHQNSEQADIDIVLMDIQMPIMDGLTATRIIRKQALYDTLPIIAMTAHARAEDKESSLDAGMNLHIAKPINSAILFSSIVSLLFPKSD
ncbi:MAG: ATP-binding protein [Colwellia sp.]|nr:ATP-binding protein [Colwellia sp.]